MTVMLRPAAAQDEPALVELLRQLGYPGAGDFIEGRMKQLAAHADAVVQVAEAESVVLGFIALHFMPQLALPRDFCRVSYLCVDERARGLGLGAKLLAFAEEQARLRECGLVELHSNERRVDAHRFYRREGYVESPKYFVKRR